MEIAGRQRRLGTFPVVQHALRTQEDVCNAVGRSPASREVRYGFSRRQKLQTRRDGKLQDFVETLARGKLSRMVCRQKTGDTPPAGVLRE